MSARPHSLYATESPGTTGRGDRDRSEAALVVAARLHIDPIASVVSRVERSYFVHFSLGRYIDLTQPAVYGANTSDHDASVAEFPKSVHDAALRDIVFWELDLEVWML